MEKSAADGQTVNIPSLSERFLRRDEVLYAGRLIGLTLLARGFLAGKSAKMRLIANPNAGKIPCFGLENPAKRTSKKNFVKFPARGILSGNRTKNRHR